MEGTNGVVVIFVTDTAHAVFRIFHLLEIDAHKLPKEVLREMTGYRDRGEEGGDGAHSSIVIRNQESVGTTARVHCGKAEAEGVSGDKEKIVE
jgi:hypothetical protein